MEIALTHAPADELATQARPGAADRVEHALVQAAAGGDRRASARPVPDADRQARYFSGQLRVVYGAETELLRALELNPQSPALRRLLESTRQHQRELRRLATRHV